MKTSITKGIKKLAAKHSPEILTGLGIAGMITSTVLAVRATPKALILIEEEKRRINKERFEAAKAAKKTSYSSVHKLKPVELVKVTWKCYIPAAVTGAVSAACLIGASSVNMRRNAALATAYTLSESTLREYRKSVVDVIGEKKEQAVRDAVAKNHVEKNPVRNNEVIVTGKGETLCFDVISGRYFKTDIEKLRRTENELNKQMRDEMYISLNEFYSGIGLSPVKIGDDLGWNINDTGYIDLCFSSQLTENDTPCLVLDYGVGPTYNYRDVY